MPVLPEVGSTSVETPGLIFPARSAASIIARPMRSFTLLAGFCASSFATTRAFAPAVTLLSCTSGVFPISRVTSLAIFTAYFLQRLRPAMVAPGRARRGAGSGAGKGEIRGLDARAAGRREQARGDLGDQRAHAVAAVGVSHRVDAHGRRAAVV